MTAELRRTIARSTRLEERDPRMVVGVVEDQAPSLESNHEARTGWVGLRERHPLDAPAANAESSAEVREPVLECGLASSHSLRPASTPEERAGIEEEPHP